jgi:DNA topoisomerase VI subunit B
LAGRNIPTTFDVVLTKRRNLSAVITKATAGPRSKLNRTTFQTSRALDFCSQRELIAQIGHDIEDWPLVIVKELVDNALDACEESGSSPGIAVHVDTNGISVSDNGPGIPPETVAAVLDFEVRVSSREAYVSPTRGAQGNALKTITAIPFAVSGQNGRIDVVSRGLRHSISFTVDQIQQKPKVAHAKTSEGPTAGTKISVHWSDLPRSQQPAPNARFLQNGDSEDFKPRSNDPDERLRFLQILDAYAVFNPHASFSLDWYGEKRTWAATDAAWRKWLPSSPTCPLWYSLKDFERLLGAYLAEDERRQTDRTVRAFVSEFRGLSGSAAQKKLLESTGMSRLNLSALRKGDELDHKATSLLHRALRDSTSRPVKHSALGIIGRAHFASRFKEMGSEQESFKYIKVFDLSEGLPSILEVAFAWNPDLGQRRFCAGINWSPCIVNPFRELGDSGGLDGILESQRAGPEEPVIIAVHFACPRVQFMDRGKSAIVIEE